MNSPSRRDVLAVLASTSLTALPRRAAAQSWPTGSVRMVVPYAAGGSIDVVARAMAAAFQQSSGQTFLVDNRAGGSGTIGLASVARARPDGYTLLVAPDNNFTVNPLIFPRGAVDANTDLIPVAKLVNLVLVIAVHESVPVRTLTEYVAYAKSRPRKVTCGSAGEGTPHHLAIRALERGAGIELIHVPYKGGAPAIADAVAGHIESVVGGFGVIRSHVASGKLRVLATFEPTRSSLDPSIPAIAETIPGIAVGSWIGLFAPAATPRAVVDTLKGWVVSAFTSGDVASKLALQGLEVVTTQPMDFDASIRRELERNRALVDSTMLQGKS